MLTANTYVVEHEHSHKLHDGIEGHELEGGEVCHQSSPALPQEFGHAPNILPGGNVFISG